MITKLHAICNSNRRPINLFVTARQVSDYNCERALLSSLPTGVLTAIVNGHKQKDIEQLLPWNYAA